MKDTILWDRESDRYTERAGVAPGRAGSLQTVAELDRLCRGFLFIQDFQPGTPATSVSVHNKAVRIFKQDYAAIFRSLPTYAQVHEEIHDA